jgi:hypothetical protein
MAEQFSSIRNEHRVFIESQKIFFVASADSSGRINLSPKGQESLCVLGPNEILWLNFTGSGNETAAHLAEANRMTLMWCAFEGPPNIMRAYGSAQVIHPRDSQWAECAEHIPAVLGARQYFRVSVDLLQTSCGYAVPLMDFVEDRSALTKWSDKKGPTGIAEYWRDHNEQSLDGKPTGILE